MTDEREERRAGLCATCRHHRTVGNRQGSIFYMCTRSKTDPRYPRYPPLPVLACPGWEDRGSGLPASHAPESG